MSSRNSSPNPLLSEAEKEPEKAPPVCLPAALTGSQLYLFSPLASTEPLQIPGVPLLALAFGWGQHDSRLGDCVNKAFLCGAHDGLRG